MYIFGIRMYNIRLMCGINVLYMYSIARDKPVYIFNYIYPFLRSILIFNLHVYNAYRYFLTRLIKENGAKVNLLFHAYQNLLILWYVYTAIHTIYIYMHYMLYIHTIHYVCIHLTLYIQCTCIPLINLSVIILTLPF